MTQILRALLGGGADVSYVGTGIPHLYESVTGRTPKMWVAPEVQADAISEKGIMVSARLAEQLVYAAYKCAKNIRAITLWATYLFPFCQAALLAKQILRSDGWRVRLVMSPAGSDVWQISPQVWRVARQLLYAPEVDIRLTYTRQFADEITKLFNTTDAVLSLYPLLDAAQFYPVSVEEKARRRRALKIEERAFVMCCHCNMRPVKRPQSVIEIAVMVAQRLHPKPVVLLMVGPKFEDATGLSSKNQSGDMLEIRWTGILGRVEEALWVSDVAINWSAHDSFNGSIMEAMASGLPVVSTSVVGIAPEVVKCECGRLFSESEMEEAAECLTWLAVDESARYEMGMRGSIHAHETFAVERLLPEYKRLLLQEEDVNTR